MNRTTTDDIHVMALLKGKERYVFIWRDEQEKDLLRTFGRFASNYELSFTWYDAAKLRQEVSRKGAKQ